ncbi:uroporphyrinogen-III C-methyltransferase [Leptothoe spongobia]|uniref:uroporphyrinogen-III C-methyltransferase n=1 Tax=Leptothoe spongobia TAU-MAC 1115 TaxID=1967444 RepID=A0A947DG40_9CYAN|nr:uroporphyrinogen-III C-methyltransferase [Leptothoe spongobia]MBT9316009.1 uroporphyrinogen-III C-methyltransferase [Leptothoe spongobia TAU-MAC 1115]
MAKSGKVYLLGAGPGNIDYLTVRGQRLLHQADCLIYDALVDPHLLSQLSPTCETIQVGKRGGQSSTPQSEINQLLVTHCQQGKQVVRLKSGDPFIFGRAAGEIQALKAADCDFEVIPGVSSALAAPLLSAIPLTDPALSHGFGVFTAHNLQNLDWATLANLETLVLLMGGRHLSQICYQLQSHGRHEDTPVAVIQWASQPQQCLWQGTLLTIAQITKGERLSPCIIVIGEVVRLREFLKPPTAGMTGIQPLANKTILVTRATGQSSAFTTLLNHQGATVIDLPALEIRPPSSWAGLDQALDNLQKFDWLVLTSANAVNFFLDRLLHQGHDLRQLAHLKLAVVGKKTARILTERGLRADFIPDNYVADALVESFPAPLPGRQILFPRVETGGRDVLVKEFSGQGATVTEVAAYESGCPATMPAGAVAALQQKRVDAITFASSKTVRHFKQLMAGQFGEAWMTVVEGVAIASIGPQTTKTCHEDLGRVDIEATTYTLEGLTDAIVQWANRAMSQS